jgi:HD domain
MKAGVKFEDWTKPHKPNLATLKLLWTNVLPSAGAAAKVARILHIGLTQHKNNQEMVGLRSDRGASIITKLGMGELAAEAVRSLDEHWDGSGYPNGLQQGEIPIFSNIANLAQFSCVREEKGTHSTRPDDAAAVGSARDLLKRQFLCVKAANSGKTWNPMTCMQKFLRWSLRIAL